MGRFAMNSAEFKIKNSLTERFEGGEKLSIKDAIEDYLKPNSPYKYLVAEKTMKSIFNAVKKEFLKDGVPFGGLSPADEHGIPTTKEEYEFMGTRRFALIKGIIHGSRIIVSSGVRKHLITAEIRNGDVLVPLLSGKVEEVK